MNSQKIKSFAASCAVAAGILAGSTAASAQRDERITVKALRADDVPKERVSYRDLDLASARDERRLMRRVNFAVNYVCPGNSYLGDSRCRASAWKRAEPQIALAVERAKQISSFGFSSIAPTAIVISVPQ